MSKDYFWALVTLIIAIILAIILLSVAREDTSQGQSREALPLPASKYDEQIFALDRQAIAAAYRAQIEHLFATWMKDATGQPERALVGARSARKAFIGAMSEIDKAEEKLRERK